MTAPCVDQSGPADTAKKRAPLAFTTSADISNLLISPAEFLDSRPDIHNIIAGAIVFRSPPGGPSSDSRRETLLLRRAASDSFPLQWEVPAGTADPTVDRSIPGVAARELWEETKLRACGIHRTVGLGLPDGVTHLAMMGDVQSARMDSEFPICLLQYAGLKWAVVTFLTEVEDDELEISLQEDEHVEWAWITEDEVKKGHLRSRPEESLDLTSEAMKMIILEGFRLMKGEA